jgi:copper homeostasis protein
MVMVRPRAAGFRYSASELAVMEEDVRAAVDAGADGVVFGALREDASVDRAACRRLRARARARETVFHRAFDLTPDPFRALEELVDLGFTRVLTSGQAPSAARGARLLARLQEAARGRIEVLPAGGIRPGNVRRLLAATGCRQVHLSAFGTARDPSSRARPALGFLADHPPEGQFHRTDPAKVRAMLRAVCSIP